MSQHLTVFHQGCRMFKKVSVGRPPNPGVKHPESPARLQPLGRRSISGVGERDEREEHHVYAPQGAKGPEWAGGFFGKPQNRLFQHSARCLR